MCPQPRLPWAIVHQSMSQGIDVGIRNNLPFILSARFAVRFEQSLPVVFDEPVQGGFRMLIHGTDGSHQAGVQESLHSFAELLRGTLGGTGNFRLQSLATSITGGAALRVE